MKGCYIINFMINCLKLVLLFYFDYGKNIKINFSFILK